MLDRFVRYREVVQLAGICAGASVLDVGCGSAGIVEFHAGTFVGCDVAFLSRPVENMQPVRASALDLPFLSQSFDVVVSSDMLEHLRPDLRHRAILELVRVGRGRVVVGCPQGRDSYRSDRLLAKWFQLRRRPRPDWLDEHLANGLPEVAELEEVLRRTGLPYQRFRNESVALHLATIMASSTPVMARLLPLLTKRLTGLALLLLTMTRRLGPAYRHIFVIDCSDRARHAEPAPNSGDLPAIGAVR